MIKYLETKIAASCGVQVFRFKIIIILRQVVVGKHY